MRTCYLHIGMHKTGTTAIQSAFARYDDGRLAYLRLSEPNHSHDLMDMFLDDGRAKNWQPIPGGSLERQRARVFAKADAQFAGSTKDYIISGEELWQRFPPPRVAAICDYLRGFFDRLVVIVYLREPLSFMESAFQEVAKRRDIFAMEYRDLFPFYRTRLQPWLDQVGAENMQFVLFDRAALAGGNAVTDFAARVGANLDAVRQEQSNTSLTAEGVAILQYARRLRGMDPTGKPDPVLRFVANIVPGFGKTPFGLDLEKAGAVIAANRDEVAWAEARLGRAFPAFRPKAGARVLRDEADMRHYARQLLPAFGLHLFGRARLHKRFARGVRAFFRWLRGWSPYR